MNNMNEDYCSFEVSKLLKEKGFEPFLHFNQCYIEVYTNDWREYTKEAYEQLDRSIGIGKSILIIRPTHALAIKWIRENFGIWILVDWCESKWCYEIQDIKRAESISRKMACHIKTELHFNSPEEATEAALLYTLNNLI